MPNWQWANLRANLNYITKSSEGTGVDSTKYLWNWVWGWDGGGAGIK